MVCLSSPVGGGLALLPQISVITPSYNQGIYIKDTIKSVITQEYPSLEYMVVDGNSTDNTLPVLNSFGSAIRWVSEPDGGQADAINKGFRQSQGSILAWLNSDDLYCQGALSVVGHLFEANPNLMMIYGDAHHVDTQGRSINPYPTSEYQWERLAFDCFICQPACFFRRSLLEEAGYLDPHLQYALDLDLWIRFGLVQKKKPSWEFLHVPELLAFSRMHLNNKTLSRRRESLLEIIQVVKKYFGYVPFNWLYRLEEASDGEYDGYFRKSPLSFSLCFRSLARWGWINRHKPRYILSFLKDCLFSPQQHFGRLTRYGGGKDR